MVALGLSFFPIFVFPKRGSLRLTGCAQPVNRNDPRFGKTLSKADYAPEVPGAPPAVM